MPAGSLMQRERSRMTKHAAALRLLIFAYWLIGSLDLAATWWGRDYLPAELRAYERDLASSSSSSFIDTPIVELWIVALLLSLIIASLAILRGHVWGRWLFLGANALMLASYPLADALIYTWFGGLLADLSLLLSGAILWACFFGATDD